MNKTNHKDRLDPITKTLSESLMRESVEQYLLETDQYEGDTLFLINLKRWQDVGVDFGMETANAILQQLAFLLQKISKRTDLVGRVGASSFLVFALGCKDKHEINVRIRNLRRELLTLEWYKQMEKEVSIHIGAVICHGKEKSYQQLLTRAMMALHKAEVNVNYLYIADDLEVLPNNIDKYMVMKKIPEYRANNHLVDLHFIMELTDLLFRCENISIAVEMALVRFCKYFNVSNACIVEKTIQEKCYETTFEWDDRNHFIYNKNLNFFPYLLMEQYKEVFDENYMLVCNRTADMKNYSRIFAEHQKILGVRSFMQSAILESGQFIGYINVGDCEKERVWSIEEISTFSFACKILSSNIIQLRSQKATRHIACNDLLTQAWNLHYFIEKGSGKLKNSSNKMAIVTLDIKNFKLINSDCSYELGNLILIKISDLLNKFIEKNECFARIEADCFVLLLIANERERLKERVLQLLSRIERIASEKDQSISLTCMAGIYIAESKMESITMQIDRANLARRSIKNYHKSTCAFYDNKEEQKKRREQKFASLMEKALRNEEFLVYYQPKVFLPSKKIAGFEALVRWKQQDGTMISPGEFIPLFEKNGFIIELDLYVFEKVCMLLRKAYDEGRTPLPIAINISRVHLKEPDFLERLKQICEKYEVPYQSLELEITESAFLDDPNLILKVAKDIKKQGFLLSMDDFGTGYSSLSLLKDLPVDTIKLDREFFQLKLNDRERVIISNVINMAKELKIQVISEGIETVEHEQFLREIGCDMAQGYLYAKPAPIEELERLIGE